jgi:integrase
MIQSSPCASIDLPRLSTARVKAWDEAQTRAFIDGVANEPYRAFWIVAVTVGIRRGELIGLRWRDVDLDRGTVTIRRTLTRTIDGKWTVGDSGKSDAAHRTVRLPRIAIDALRHRRADQAERRNDLGVWAIEDAVFDRGDGAHLTDPTRVQRQFKRIVDRLGLPDITVHGLRHCAATNALRAGVPVHAVARMLGHADASVTLRCYSHVLADLEAQSVDRIDALFVTNPGRSVTNL